MSATEGAVKAETIKKYQVHDKDSGSPEVQIALLTKRLEELAGHFKNNPNDRHSQRGMLAIISRRKKLLTYLKDENADRYKRVINSLGLRK